MRAHEERRQLEELRLVAQEGALALDVAEPRTRKPAHAVHVEVVRRRAVRRGVDLSGVLGVEVLAADGARDLRHAPLALQTLLHVLQI